MQPSGPNWARQDLEAGPDVRGGVNNLWRWSEKLSLVNPTDTAVDCLEARSCELRNFLRCLVF